MPPGWGPPPPPPRGPQKLGCPHRLVRAPPYACAGVWGRSSILGWHSGSPLRLGLVLAVANGSIAQFVYLGFDGFWQPFVAATLPLTLVPLLAASWPLCGRLLQDAAAHEPLADLHSLLRAAQ